MSTQNLNTNTTSNNIVYFCHSCDSLLESKFVNVKIVFVYFCIKCSHWELQSSEEDGDAVSRIINDLGPDLPQPPSINISIPYNPFPHFFTDKTKTDVKNWTKNFQNWIFNGASHGKSFVGTYVNMSPNTDKYISLLEDVCILLDSLMRASHSVSRYTAIVNFCKLRGSRLDCAGAFMMVLSDIFGTTLMDKKAKDEYWNRLREKVCEEIYFEQSDSVDNNPFASLRSYLNQWDKFKETVIVQKLQRFGLYVLTAGLLDKTPITFKSLNYSKFEERCAREAHRPGLSMLECFLDTILFICERGHQYFVTGDIQTIFHSGSSYELWVMTAQRLIRESNFLNNPTPHGINKFTFLSELKDAIEKGAGIVKFTAKLEKTEKLMLQKLLNDLQLIENQELTRKEAQKPRKDPFSILIHGASSICKSQLKQILFYHYAKCFQMPCTPEYMYTRCPTDEFWSGFNSTQWCIVMDDIAFLKPNGGEVDPTLKEMLQIKNPTPYVPPQADLADKGRTPVRAELLIGTTNTRHLNLHAYFACPFAIARRFPYIISAKVKREYARFECMADSSKIPVTAEGDYMNIWDFTISIPVPAGEMGADAQQTTYKEIHVFTDIHDMLAWYITVAKEYEIAQQKAMAADNTMSAITVCDKCYRTVTKCVCFTPQAEEEFSNMSMGPAESPPQEPELDESILRDVHGMSRFKYWVYLNTILCMPNNLPYEDEFGEYAGLVNNTIWFIALICIWYIPFLFRFGIVIVFCTFVFKYIWVMCAWMCHWYLGDYWKLKLAFLVFKDEESVYRVLFRYAGMRTKQAMADNYPQLKRVRMFVIYVTTYWGLLYVINKVVSPKKFEEQSVSQGVIPEAHTTEKPVFYYNDPYAVTDVDISCQSRSAPAATVMKSVDRNLAKFFFFWPLCNKTTVTTGFNVKGNLWLFNQHCFKEDKGVLTVIVDDITKNVSRNMRNISVSRHDVSFVDGQDLCMIQLLAVAPNRSVDIYFPLTSKIGGCHLGASHMIGKDGVRYTRECVNVRPFKCPVFGVPAYEATMSQETQVGDCGSVLTISTGGKNVILGLHAAGNKRSAIFHAVSQELIAKFSEKFGMQVSQGTIKLDEPGYAKEIGPLHSKAAVRFIEQGSAAVMGSMQGYRPAMKSKVKPTFIKEFVKDEYPLEYGPPSFSWQPWSLAIKDMVNPTFTFDNEVLRQCTTSFLMDIVRGMKGDFSSIQVYTLDVALNGVDGVTYVDKINTNTSAGLPFRCSKKKFLDFDGLGKISKVDDVVMNRMNDILDTYSKGEQFHPLFCNHLKDDPTPAKKIAAHKTRVFSGGEFAWAIIVRRFFLSHVRMIQNNPFVFEAMPGVVAQSEQWHDLYNYLTKFGTSQMVAGDYGKFDKKMAAPFILCAFDILIQMAKQAGWSNDDLQVLHCIAYDTAFPTMDFHGDLIQVQGNPSGHPLTVIINCLVNSLYMRYAYVLTTGNNPATFKRDVSLATYGDDNVMGVSPECPAFNHTAISRAMAQIGVEYTMADKESESRPYIDMSEVSFLKRIFRWDPEMKSYMAVLERASINKMLTAYVDSGVLAPQAHSVRAIETALREYFFHGREIFEERKAYLKHVVERANLDSWVMESTFPDYDQMAIDFWKRHITEENFCTATERLKYFAERSGVNRKSA